MAAKLTFVKRLIARDVKYILLIGCVVVFWYLAFFPGRLGYDYSLAIRMIQEGESTDWWTSTFFLVFTDLNDLGYINFYFFINWHPFTNIFDYLVCLFVGYKSKNQEINYFHSFSDSIFWSIWCDREPRCFSNCRNNSSIRVRSKILKKESL